MMTPHVIAAFKSANGHRGFLMPLAAVLIAGVAVLAIAISHMASHSNHSGVQEGLSLQAFYAAESGAQYSMNQLFFNVNDRAAADVNCASLTGSSLSFSASGLNTCSSNLTCTVSTDAGDTTSFYSVVSEATCGSGDFYAERTITVSAFIQ